MDTTAKHTPAFCFPAPITHCIEWSLTGTLNQYHWDRECYWILRASRLFLLSRLHLTAHIGLLHWTILVLCEVATPGGGGREHRKWSAQQMRWWGGGLHCGRVMETWSLLNEAWECEPLMNVWELYCERGKMIRHWPRSVDTISHFGDFLLKKWIIYQAGLYDRERRKPTKDMFLTTHIFWTLFRNHMCLFIYFQGPRTMM